MKNRRMLAVVGASGALGLVSFGLYRTARTPDPETYLGWARETNAGISKHRGQPPPDNTPGADPFAFVSAKPEPEVSKARELRVSLPRKRAEEALLERLGQDLEWKELAECAVEIQNLHKPALLGPVLERLERAGLLSDAKRMPWLSAKLLSEHIRASEGEELSRALRAAGLRPSLARATAEAAQEKLAQAGPEVGSLASRPEE